MRDQSAYIYKYLTLCNSTLNKGNCFNPPSIKTVNVLVCNGVEEEFWASTTVGKITSGLYQSGDVVLDAQSHLPLPGDAKVGSGEVSYLHGSTKHQCIPKVSLTMVNYGIRESQKVKIVVTKQQLESLVRSAKEFHSRIMLPSFKDRGCQKWRPSLATIPEL